MKKPVSGTARPVKTAGGAVLPTSVKVTGLPGAPAKPFANKVADSTAGGQALLQKIDRLQRKLIRDLS